MTISRKIRCKKCGFNGVVEAHDTQNYPPEKIFQHLGKDVNGYLHFRCPSCGADEPYSPYAFINAAFKLGCLVFIALFVWLVSKLLL